MQAQSNDVPGAIPRRGTTRTIDTGMWLTIGAALLFACKGTLIKYIYTLGAGVADVMILRLLFSMPIFLWVVVRQFPAADKRPRWPQWLGVALCGVGGYYVSSYLDMLGLQTVSAGLERMILYTYPAFVVVFSAMLFRRPISVPICFSIAIIYIGLALVFFADLRAQPAASHAAVATGALYVLLCAVSFAGYVIGSEYYMRIMSSALFTAVAMLAAGVAMMLHYALFQSLTHLLQLSGAVYAWCALTAIACTVVPAFMMSAGVRRIGSAKAGAIGMVGPVATVSIAAAVLGEAISGAQLLGLLVVVFGVHRLHRL